MVSALGLPAPLDDRICSLTQRSNSLKVMSSQSLPKSVVRPADKQQGWAWSVHCGYRQQLLINYLHWSVFLLIAFLYSFFDSFLIKEKGREAGGEREGGKEKEREREREIIIKTTDGSHCWRTSGSVGWRRHPPLPKLKLTYLPHLCMCSTTASWAWIAWQIALCSVLAA